MNIFYLDHDVKRCAEMHVDRHVVKMISEYCQLLATAHRVLDGKETVVTSSSGRKKKIFLFEQETIKNGSLVNPVCFSATHVNHPSAVWVRESLDNYNWLVDLTLQLHKEWKYRYGHPATRVHESVSKNLFCLASTPVNILSKGPTPLKLAMPDRFIIKKKNGEVDSIASYRNLYANGKSHLHAWKNRPVPDFINEYQQLYGAK